MAQGFASAVLAIFLLGSAAAHATCKGDCDGSGGVGVNELVTMVSIALDAASMDACRVADTNADGKVSVSELVAAVNSALVGCATAATPTPTPNPLCPDAQPFASTFAAIQKVVFEHYGCTESVCHGRPAMQGGLDLSPDVAYRNIIDVRSAGSTLCYVTPGDKDRSYLWLKLAAKTNPALLPAGFQIAGSPMPNAPGALSDDALDALRLWIYSGAPETGTVAGTEPLLGACLPTPEPITIKPLDPPPAGTGLQFVMPPWQINAHSEREVCFATYYDVSSQVPPEFQDPSGTMFRFSESELRQDPQSHHLILSRYVGKLDDIHDPSFGEWTCIGGDRAGAGCEPTDVTSCGDGFCTSQIKNSFACVGFGPPAEGVENGENPLFRTRSRIGGAQSPQSHNAFIDGVFAQIPMRGILYWNSHAFNLTDEDATLHARINYGFATDPRLPVMEIFDTSRIFAPDAAPFTTQTICNDHVLDQGTRLFGLASHTHKHGRDFTIYAPDGSLLYESFTYNDPVDLTFDPPLAFDSPDPAQRTLRYCSLYNNGENADGSPNPDVVTRRSRIPSSAANTLGQCRPVACAEGKIGAACNGVGDDRVCDTAPGAGDGWCDACKLTGGESTENEMFVLNGWYYLETPSP
jgi:hypothetical protein